MTPDEALAFAVRAALQATCQKSRRGVVLFRREDAEIVSSGFNGPPPGFVCTGSDACRGACNKVAIHAEDRAIRFAGWHARGADLLHVKVVDELPDASGGPSCWQCSRTVVDAGIAGVWLLHEGGLKRYTAQEFHRLTLRECGLPEFLV